MSADNYGFFLIGLPLKEIDENLVPGFKDNEYNYSYLSDYLDSYGHKLLPKGLVLKDWVFGIPSGYESTNLIGAYLQSGRYDFDEYDYYDFVRDQGVIFGWLFNIVFVGKLPKVYMGNIQG